MRLLPLVMLLAWSGAAAASPLAGTWRAPVKGAVIEVYDCGAEVCGRVLDSDDLRANPDLRDVHNRSPADRSRKVRGLTMMTGFKGGPPVWTGGVLYDPSSGNSYAASITLPTPDRLVLKGCLFGPFCLSQTWTRVR
jgi:uncharacterized protein (DUF2147 family)